MIASPTTLACCFERLATQAGSYIHLLVDIHRAQRRISSKTRARRMRPLLELLPSVATEMFRALSVHGKPPLAVSQVALSLLDQAAETATPFVLDKIVPMMIVTGSTPSAAIRRWLVETTDNRLAKAAAEVAIRVQDNALVWLALDHARADAREAAIAYLSAAILDPLPPRLLELSSDPGSRVRRTLVRILVARPHPEHQRVLLQLIDDDWSDAEPSHNDVASYPIAREAIVGLAAYSSLSDDIGQALLFRAERTDDRSLGVVALDTAAQCCGAAIRKKIWALSFIDAPRWVRVDAIDALSRADVVESEILDAITPSLLLKLAPPLAASACVLLATHGQVEAVTVAMERIACSANRRALLLLGVCGLADRDRLAATRLLALLEPDHPACRLLDLADSEKLPKTVLDDLGHVRFRKAVHGWLNDKIEND